MLTSYNHSVHNVPLPLSSVDRSVACCCLLHKTNAVNVMFVITLTRQLLSKNKAIYKTERKHAGLEYTGDPNVTHCSCKRPIHSRPRLILRAHAHFPFTLNYWYFPPHVPWLFSHTHLYTKTQIFPGSPQIELSQPTLFPTKK